MQGAVFIQASEPSIGNPQIAIMAPKNPIGVAPPAVTVVDIDDPTMAGAEIELIDQDVMQLKSTPFRARRVIVRLGSATVVFHSHNLRLRTRTSACKDLIAFVTFGPRATGTVNGVRVRPGLMLTAESDAEVQFVSEPGWESITFLLPPQEISAHLIARQRETELRLPHGVETLLVDPVRACRLFDWGKRLVDTAARQPDLFDDRENGRAAAAVELWETLLSTLEAASEFEPTRNDRTRQAHSLIVKIAEDYALSRVGEHLHVSDLCRVAATSERSLENAFKDVMGLTPVTYLMRLRLHRVRKALLEATQGSTRVSVEALNWGFWHFGEFSRAYRECFGELPSDTLRRKPGESQQQGKAGKVP